VVLAVLEGSSELRVGGCDAQEHCYDLMKINPDLASKIAAVDIPPPSTLGNSS
jgi:hypothetical protein